MLVGFVGPIGGLRDSPMSIAICGTYRWLGTEPAKFSLLLLLLLLPMGIFVPVRALDASVLS